MLKRSPNLVAGSQLPNWRRSIEGVGDDAVAIRAEGDTKNSRAMAREFLQEITVFNTPELNRVVTGGGYAGPIGAEIGAGNIVSMFEDK
jgi:hypothetical protein